MSPGATDAPDERGGIAAGVGAYGLWGLFPLVFHQLGDVTAGEILLHRIIWSFVVVLLLLAWRGPRGWLAPLRRDRRQMARLVTASLLIATNWLVYIWAVNNDHVIEAALGYYINPLLTVALGVVVLDEHLRRAQLVALGFGVASVAVLTVAYGRLPWIALVLAVSFAGYGFQKKAVTIGAAPSLLVETAVLFPVALVALVAPRGVGRRTRSSTGAPTRCWRQAVQPRRRHRGAAAALRRRRAARIRLLRRWPAQYLTPTLQLLCGVVVLGEELTPSRLAGFALVWVALIVLATDAVHASRRSARVAEPMVVPELA